MLSITVLPVLFFMPALDYLNLPREIFWTGGAALLIAWLVYKKKSSWRIETDSVDRAFLLFLAWCALSATWAQEPQHTWVRLSVLLASGLTFYLCRRADDKLATKILWVILLQGFLFSIIGILQNAEIYPFSEILQTEKPGITMGHRNVAAEYLLLCLAAPLVFFLSGGKKLKVFSIITFALCLSVMFIIQCRGVLLGMLLATAVTSCFGWSKKKSLLVLILITVVCIPIFTARLPGVNQGFHLGKMESIRMRMAHYSNSLIIARDHLPFGVGLGNFPIYYSRYTHAWLPDTHYSDRLILKNAHCDPLEFLVELGPMALLLMIFISIKVLRSVRLLSKNRKALFWAFLALCFNSLFNFPFQVTQTLMLAAVLLGLTLRGQRIGRVKTNSLEAFSFPIKAVSILLLFAFVFFQAQRLRSNTLARQGLGKMLQGKHHEALPLLKQAVGLTPKHVDTRMLQAYCLREMGFRSHSSSVAENVLGIFPAYLPALNLIGLNAIEDGDYIRALRAYEESYRWQPYSASIKKKYLRSATLLANAFRARAQYKHALQLQKKISRAEPEREEPFYMQVADALNAGELKEARNVFSASVHKKPSLLKFICEVRLLKAEGHDLQAQQVLKEALRLYPKDQILLKLKGNGPNKKPR